VRLTVLGRDLVTGEGLLALVSALRAHALALRGDPAGASAELARVAPLLLESGEQTLIDRVWAAIERAAGGYR
jgi:hypothetical protein